MFQGGYSGWVDKICDKILWVGSFGLVEVWGFEGVDRVGEVGFLSEFGCHS